jgi:hypothetical protein
MVSGIVTDGLGDLLIQYFKLLFNFTVQDVVRFNVCTRIDVMYMLLGDCLCLS